MTIQINTDKTLNGSEAQHEYFKNQIATALKRHEEHITRIEVHLKDENGKKEGVNDISCLLEARIEGKQPIAVNSKADTVHQAVSAAIEKVESAVEKIIGKMKAH